MMYMGKFLQTILMTEYTKVYTGEMLYNCDVCRKSIAQKSIQSKLMKVHTEERPYKCHMCGTQFNTEIYIDRTP